MEGCFTFQWGRFVFQMGEGGGASFISVGWCPIGGALVLVGEGFRKKS